MRTIRLIVTLACSIPIAVRAQIPPSAVQHLGTVRFPISCSAAVRPDFDRAVAWLHSFAFPSAAEGFQSVLRADPHCAIAYWGLALTAWGNPFAAGIKPPAQLARGLAAVQSARSAGAPSERERGYIDAAAQLFEHADVRDQRTRVTAYRDSMAALAEREPADTEAAIFHALAQAFAADPGDKSYADQLAAGATLERLFTALPDHPGLAHYIIHSYDVPPLAARALAAAQRYSRIAPSVSHALHMPSHTYTRLGSWQESISSNIVAGAAARREGSTAEALHATDYRAYAYLQTGQDRAARDMVDTVASLAPAMSTAGTTTGAPPAAGYFAIAAVPARYALERGDWADAAKLELHPSPTPFADAMTWFARGLGAARSGDTLAAHAAVSALESLRDTLGSRHEAYWAGQVDIQRRGAYAWLLYASGRRADALAEMSAAADQEDATEKNAITPAPLAPARELLGEMLLGSHQPDRALVAFDATLSHEPNRHRALAGAEAAARQAGDQPKAAKYHAELVRLCGRADQPGRCARPLS